MNRFLRLFVFIVYRPEDSLIGLFAQTFERMVSHAYRHIFGSTIGE